MGKLGRGGEEERENVSPSIDSISTYMYINFFIKTTNIIVSIDDS
jgi:hypothetical protein